VSAPVTGPVLIIGSGLLGASVGLALRRAGVSVWLDDSDPEALAAAVERGAGQAWGPHAPRPALIVVAVPPDVAGEVMARASEHADATVTDVTSVKAQPLAQARARGADPLRLVGGHPMAGREMSGPGAARPDLFDDRIWVISPLPESEGRRVEAVRDLAVTCGGVPVVLSPVEHDEAVALTSHTPQVLSSLLGALLLEADDDAVTVSGQGLRDMTRIAESDPVLWDKILGANAEAVVPVLEAYSRSLSHLIECLRSSGDVSDVLARGIDGRRRIPGKHGAEAARYDVVPVIIKDEPGELARLFTGAGNLGVNLEDVRIDHVLGKPSGLVELSVRPESTDALVTGLRSHGFDVRA
jgi:prephenate dehydrogenase